MYKSIGCIGYGNMGQAFVEGIHRSLPDVKLFVFEKDKEKAALAHSNCKAVVVEGIDILCQKVEAIILAIKPQDAGPILDNIRTSNFKGAILSVLGGKLSSWIAERSGNNLVARYMPSLSATIGKGAVALCFAPNIGSAPASVQLKTHALALGSSIGSVYEIPETQMGAFTGVSGSGIAFAWEFMHALAMGGVKNGLPYAQALQMVSDMLIGAASVIKQTGENPISLVSKVCSPAGTTIEGMKALYEGGFDALCMDAVTRVTQRSKELES